MGCVCQYSKHLHKGKQIAEPNDAKQCAQISSATRQVLSHSPRAVTLLVLLVVLQRVRLRVPPRVVMRHPEVLWQSTALERNLVIR